MQQDERRAHSRFGARKRSSASTTGPALVSRRESFVDGALNNVGTKARPGSLTEFGRRVGYYSSTISWAGAFVDCVACDSDVAIPSCVYPPSGLAEFIFMNRWRSDPEPGDIVFYTFSTRPEDPFGTPHIGIVVDTDAWKKEQYFMAVEADIQNSVVTRMRWKYETIGFGRPDWKRRPGKAAQNADGLVFVNPARIQPGARGKDVFNMQVALRKVVDLSGETPAVFDSKTQRAYARWQRMIGHVGHDIDGVPNERTLAQLGARSEVFTTVAPEN